MLARVGEDSVGMDQSWIQIDVKEYAQLRLGGLSVCLRQTS